jgi:hypothetical protein
MYMMRSSIKAFNDVACPPAEPPADPRYARVTRVVMGFAICPVLFFIRLPAVSRMAAAARVSSAERELLAASLCLLAQPDVFRIGRICCKLKAIIRALKIRIATNRRFR